MKKWVRHQKVTSSDESRGLYIRGKIGNCKFKTGEKNGGMDHRRTQSSRVQLMDMKFVLGPRVKLGKRIKGSTRPAWTYPRPRDASLGQTSYSGHLNGTNFLWELDVLFCSFEWGTQHAHFRESVERGKDGKPCHTLGRSGREKARQETRWWEW